jgi:hypothetical protein
MIRCVRLVARIREAINSTQTGQEKCIQNFSWQAWKDREHGYPGAVRKILFKHTAYDTANWQVHVNYRFCTRLGTSWPAQRPAAVHRKTRSVRTINHNSTLTSQFSTIRFSFISTSKRYRNQYRLGMNGISVTYVALMMYIRFHA